MTLAYVITRADAVGGASIHVRDLACAMKARGHEVTVLVGGSGPVTEQFERAGISFQQLRYLQRPIHPLADWMAFKELLALLQDVRPDLVSTHTAKAGWLGRAACARLGIPVVYTPHGLTVGDRMGRLQGLVYGAAERVAGRWADAIVCVSEYERELAARNRICPPDRLHVIHNGVRSIPDDLCANPGPGGACIVSVARLEAPKDHETLLRAFAAVDSTWMLELIGDGPREPELRRLCSQLGIELRVRFRGYLHDPAEALAASHIFVLSSRSEGFPRSILEAMRAGLPVIASDVGGVREAVRAGVTGMLVAPGDVAELGDALRRMTSDPNARQRMGAAGHQTWADRFRLETMVEKTGRLYATLVSG